MAEPQIFLCYSSEDKAVIDDIFIKLKDAGLNPWMDKPPSPFGYEGLQPGSFWDTEIKKK